MHDSNTDNQGTGRFSRWLDRFRPDRGLGDLADLQGWRNYYLDLLLRFAPVLLIAALVVSIPSLLEDGLYGIIAFNAGGVILCVLLRIFTKSSLSRGIIIFTFFSGMIVTIFISLGPLYESPGWLVLISVGAALLLGAPGALGIISVNAVIFTILYLYVGPYLDSWESAYEAPTRVWVMFLLNISLLSLAASLPVSLLLKRLDISFSSETELRKKVLAESAAFRVANDALKNEIAERRQVETALRRSEERFHAVAASADEWIWEIDAQGLYMYCSEAIEPILGYTPEEVVGKRYFYDLFAPNVRQRLKEDVLFGFAMKKRFRNFINPCVHKNGSIVILETSAAPFLDEEGTFRGYRGADTDVTERRQAEEALRLSEEHFRTLFNEMSEGVVMHRFVRDEKGNTVNYEFLDVNPQYEAIFNLTREDVIGRLATDVYRVPAPPYLDEFLKGTAAGGSYTFKAFATSVQKHLHVSVSPMGDDRFAALLSDITDRRNLEAQLLQAQKMEAIGTLAGGIAHDFNNILGGIMGYTELVLTRHIPPDHPARGHLQESLRGAARARDLVAQIMTLSRGGDQTKQPMEITPILKEAMKLLRASLPSSIEIRTKIGPVQKKVFASPVQIHQVLMNLCTNAAQAMKERGGNLEVSLDLVAFGWEEALPTPSLSRGIQYELLTVGDTGHGIPPEIVDRIFDPFFTTKKQGEGTGLGLAVVYGIVVKNLDGAVEVASTPGAGTTFKIYLPVTEGIEDGETGNPEKVIFHGSERILFVDDEKTLTNVFKIQLEDLGYTVDCCNDPVEAIGSFVRNHAAYDLVITDMTMPHMTGVDLAAEIKEIRPDIPVILSSGTLDAIDPERTKKYGIAGTIKKPASIRDMAATIRKVLDSR